MITIKITIKELQPGHLATLVEPDKPDDASDVEFNAALVHLQSIQDVQNRIAAISDKTKLNVNAIGQAAIDLAKKQGVKP